MLERAERAALRRRAGRVQAQAALLAVGGTALALACRMLLDRLT